MPSPPAVSPIPTRIRPPATPGPSGLATLAVAIVCIVALYLGREVFIPLVLAVLLSFVLAPVVDFLRRWFLPRAIAIVLAVVLALGVIVALGAVIGMQVADLGANLPRYQATMQEKATSLQKGVIGDVSALIHKATIAVHNEGDATGKPAAGEAEAGGKPAEKPLLVRLPQEYVSPLVVAETVLGPILSPLTTLGIVLVVVIFLLMQREDLRDRMIRLFGSSDLHRTTLAMDDAAGRLSRYFLTQLGINAAFGIIVAIGLWAIGVPSPILWGVVGMLLRFVPYIGAAISALLPIVLAAAVTPGWSMAIETAGLFLVTESIMGQVVEPLLYGHSTGLSPFAVIVSALFWSWLWGPIGLVLSTPFTVVLVVLGRHVEHLEFLDVLLGDRPALTPIENFYQRILAGDPDEARDHAELLLKDRSLISYYDDVALAGLQLAANDARRGVLDEAKIATMVGSVLELLEDLAQHDDVQPDASKTKGNADVPSIAEQGLPKPETVPEHIDPEMLRPEWRHPNSVLCIAGRGPLDDAAAAILAQLLRKHGLGARTVSHEEASRSAIATLDLTGVVLVCVAYLEATGSPSHLRYLLQRLRARLPGRKLLVGLWPIEEPIMTDAAMQAALGADAYVGSFREAVGRCIDEAKAQSQETVLVA